MRTFITLVAAAAVLTLALAPAAAAKTTRVQVEGYETLSEVVSEGSMSMAGSVVSVRGIVWIYTQTGHRMLSGTDRVVINYDLDLATGSGELWGKNRIDPTAYPGGHFDCSWHGTFVDYAWTGKVVCHGDGSLRGWQLRLALLPEPGGEADTTVGFAFLPGH